MITGAVYILAAFLSPDDLAAFVLSAIAIIGSLLVVGRCLFAMTRPKSQA